MKSFLVLVVIIATSINSQAQVMEVASYCENPSIIGASPNRHIPYCMDSLVFSTFYPIPVKDHNSPYDACYEVTYSVDSKDVVLKTRTEYTVGSKRIVVYPLEPFLTYTGDISSLRHYKLIMRCGFWDASNDLVLVTPFTKQNVRRVRVESRNKATNEPTSSNGARSSGDGIITPILEDFSISAKTIVDNLQFLEWSCSLPDIKFEKSTANQPINYRCWPTPDTVVFTAWYGKTTEVDENADAYQNEIWYDASNLTLNLSTSQRCDFSVFNVQGSLFVTGIADELSTNRIPFQAPPGVYLVVLSLNNGCKASKVFTNHQP